MDSDAGIYTIIQSTTNVESQAVMDLSTFPSNQTGNCNIQNEGNRWNAAELKMQTRCYNNDTRTGSGFSGNNFYGFSYSSPEMTFPGREIDACAYQNVINNYQYGNHALSPEKVVINACHKIGSYSAENSPEKNACNLIQGINNENNNSFAEKNKENRKSPVRRTLKKSLGKLRGFDSKEGVCNKDFIEKSENNSGKSDGTQSEIDDADGRSQTGSAHEGDVSNYDNVMVWLNQQACGGTVKRKRRITKTQRVAANQRERKRMVHLNTAFEHLRETIPSFPYEKKLSRIQTLKLAIDYIAFMTEILYGKNSFPAHSYTFYAGSDSSDFQHGAQYW